MDNKNSVANIKVRIHKYVMLKSLRITIIDILFATDIINFNSCKLVLKHNENFIIIGIKGGLIAR